MPAILKGRLAVAMYDVTGLLLDATGVQSAIGLDAMFSRSAAQRRYGVHFSDRRPTFRVWAPTAQKVTLLTWPAGSDPGGADVGGNPAGDDCRRRRVVERSRAPRC